jgi:hypothetical protein
VSPPRPSAHELFQAAPPGLLDAYRYPFFNAVFDRKSRRVGLGMEIDSGVLSYQSPYEPVPLSELE